MNSGTLEAVEVAKAHQPVLPVEEEKAGLEHFSSEKGSHGLPVYAEATADGGHPTEDELHSLRRVSGQVPWTAYTIAIVELCERFSYYGTTAVCMECPEVSVEMGIVAVWC